MTPFGDIYVRFLSQITSYDLLALDNDTLEDNLKPWLLSSIGFFVNCRKNLFDLDETLGFFNEELDSMEIDILAKLMVYTYISTHAITEENTKQKLNSRDYRMYSPANQLKVLLDTQARVSSDVDLLMSRYSYNIHRLKEERNKKWVISH